MYVSQLRDLSA